MLKLSKIAQRYHDNIMQSINDDTFFDETTTLYSHFESHSNQNLVNDLNLILNDKTAQGHFQSNVHSRDDLEEHNAHGRFCIEEAIINQTEQISKWLEYAENGERFEANVRLDADDYDPVGTIITFDRRNNTIKEFETDTVRAVLIRDTQASLGFTILTAYPSFYRANLTPTGLDLSKAIEQTDDYAKADDIGKMYLKYRTDPNAERLATYLRGDTPEDSMMMFHVPDKDDPEHVIHKIKIKEQGITMKTYTGSYKNGRWDKSTEQLQMNPYTFERFPEARFKYDGPRRAFLRDYPDLKNTLEAINDQLRTKNIARSKARQLADNSIYGVSAGIEPKSQPNSSHNSESNRTLRQDSHEHRRNTAISKFGHLLEPSQHTEPELQTT